MTGWTENQHEEGHKRICLLAFWYSWFIKYCTALKSASTEPSQHVQRKILRLRWRHCEKPYLFFDYNLFGLVSFCVPSGNMVTQCGKTHLLMLIRRIPSSCEHEDKWGRDEFMWWERNVTYSEWQRGQRVAK